MAKSESRPGKYAVNPSGRCGQAHNLLSSISTLRVFFFFCNVHQFSFMILKTVCHHLFVPKTKSLQLYLFIRALRKRIRTTRQKE